jgi:hypothetical protein
MSWMASRAIRFIGISMVGVVLADIALPNLVWQGFSAGLWPVVTFLLFLGTFAILLPRLDYLGVIPILAFASALFTIPLGTTLFDSLSYASSPYFQLLMFTFLFVGAYFAMSAANSPRLRRSAAAIVSSLSVAAFLFIFFGWNGFPILYAQYTMFAALFLGSLALMLLLSSRPRWSRIAGIVMIAGFLFFLFVPVYATPYGTFESCGPTGCGSHTQYTSLSYAYIGMGGVYQTPYTYWVGPALSA